MVTKMYDCHKIRSTATLIASTNIQGGNYTTDLYAHWASLYRTTKGKYVVMRQGGAGITNAVTDFLPDSQAAAQWIVSHADDPITGYGYSREQAEIMLDGGDPGPGYTDHDEA